MKKWIFILILTLIIITGIYLPFTLKKHTSSNEVVAKVVDKNIFVSALGRIEPQGKIVHLSTSLTSEGARLAQLLVKEGDIVHAGQVVAILDGQSKQAAVLEAEQQVIVAQRKLEQVQAGAKQSDLIAQQLVIERLEVERHNAQLNLQRIESLYSSGIVSKTELETKQVAVKVLEKDIERAQASLKSLAEVRTVDLRTAEAEVTSALATVEKARANLAMTYIKSITSGRVLKINTRPGENINSNGILDLGETNQMYVIAEVFEADIARVQIGQKTEITLRSTNQILQGTVEHIGLEIHKTNVLNTDPIADTDVRVIEVHIRINKENNAQVSELTNARVDVRINGI